MNYRERRQCARTPAYTSMRPSPGRAMIANSSPQLGWLAPCCADRVRAGRHCFTRCATACIRSGSGTPDCRPARSPTRGRSAAGGGRYRQAAGGRAGNSAQTLGHSAAANRSPGAQTGVGDTAACTVGTGPLTSPEVSVAPTPKKYSLPGHAKQARRIAAEDRGLFFITERRRRENEIHGVFLPGDRVIATEHDLTRADLSCQMA